MRNTWKKTAAFVLSMALVAGAMPANLGGFLTGGKGIVANAEESVPVADDGFSDGFEDAVNWNLVNGDCTNAWTVGTATNNGGEKSLYISNDGGTTNAYSTAYSTFVCASKKFYFRGNDYDFFYDWLCNGESNYDFMRVALVPDSVSLSAGMNRPSGFEINSLPDGWIALDGGAKLNISSNWSTMAAENISVEEGFYNVVFAWRSDNSGGGQPPAAIDNFRVVSIAHDPYNVTLVGGENTDVSGGSTTQADVTRKIDKVTYTANAGYWFAPFENGDTITKDGIEVKRINDTTIEVTGIPSDNTTITIPDAVAVPALTVNGADNVTVTGSEEFDNVNLTCTAAEGYWFAPFEDITEENGLTIKRTGSYTVTITGSITANSEVNVPGAVQVPDITFTGGENTTVSGRDGDWIYTANAGYVFDSFETQDYNGITVEWKDKYTVAISGYTENAVTVPVPNAIVNLTVFEEDFSNGIPSNWNIYSGLINNVLSGNVSLTQTTSGWNSGTTNGVFDNHVRLNIYGTVPKYWLVTPQIALNNEATLSFDMALTRYSGTLSPVTPGNQADDRFVVLITDDDGASWNILREWNNTDSEYVYDNITCSATGENVSIDLSDYAGKNVKIAFYGESTESNGDNNLHIDNVEVILAPPKESPEFSSVSLTLGDDLALNFYVDSIADDTAAADYIVNFTGACVDESSALVYNADNGKYYATTHVYAKDIDKDITATLCKGDETVDTLADYSISEYLTAAQDEADEKTSALITATKDFGNASAEYFYGDDYGVTAAFASYNPDVTAYAPSFTSDEAKLSLVLDSKTAARLYVKDDATGEESTISSTKADYPSYHEVTGLLPQNLADEQTITVGDTDYKFSALSWCNRVLNNADATEKNITMAKAIMAYYEAAKNYTTVDVSSVTLDQSTLTLTAGGDTATLSATVLPDNATDKTVTWSSNNEAVATVVNGVVTPVAAGTATITATAGGKSATCEVTVKAATRTVTFNTATDGTSINKGGVTCSDSFDGSNNLFGDGSGFSVSSGQFTKIEVTADDSLMVGMDQETWNIIEGWSTTLMTATWTGKSSTVPFGVIMGNGQPVTIVFTIEE